MAKDGARRGSPATDRPPRTTGSTGSFLSRILGRADTYQQRRPGFAVPFAIVRKFGDDRGGHWASLIAFYGFFSLFPLLLVLVTSLGFAIRDDPELQRRIIDSALSQFPVIGPQIERNIHAIAGSSWALVLGLAAATWSGMQVIGAVQDAMDEIWNVPRVERPGWMRRRVVALVTLGILGVALIVSGVLAGFGTAGGWAGPVLRPLLLLATLCVNVAVLAGVFRILTRANLTWRDVLPGALAGGVAWMGLLFAGTWIVDRKIRESTEIYGFFAIVIGLLAWMALGAQILMLAAELNAVLKRRMWPRSLLQQRPGITEADARALRGEATEERARPDESVRVRFEERAGSEG